MAAKIPKQVSLFYFTCIGEDIWQCKCTQKRKQIANKGYSNLNSHIAVAHPNWKDEYGSSQKLGFSAVVPSQKVSRKGTNIFRWLDWVMMESLPFSFCDRELVRQNAVLEPISTDTLVRYVDLTLEKVEGKLADLLPDKLVLIVDGWSFNEVHHFAFFAKFLNAESNEILYPLLAVLPLQDEEDLSAESHYQFIATTLQIYNKTTSSVIAFVADNKNLNGAIAKLMKVPMIGCASHRLNLAVNRYLSSYEPILSKIQNLMVNLSSIKRKAKLKKMTIVSPPPPLWAEDWESFAKDLLLAKKRKTEAEYVSLEFIPGTPNICERLFSKGKLTLGMLRQNLSPMHLEVSLFLRISRKLCRVG